MKFILDLADTLSQPEVEQLVVSNGWTLLQTFEGLGNTVLVESSSEVTAGGDIESAVRDDTAPIQLLTSFSLDQPTVIDTIQANDLNSWWKTFTVNEVDHNQPDFSLPRRGDDSVVYVVDSGIKSDHPEFASASIENLYSFTGNFTDTNGHGTALISLIVGAQCGVTAAQIKVVKIFEDGTPTYQSHILAALDAIAQDVDAAPHKTYVVNMSWNIARNQYIENKIALLIMKGVSVVAAAGNSGASIEDITPAAMSEVITVGSYDENFNPCDFSNYTGSAISNTQGQTNGGALDVWAPGINIRAAKLDGTLAMIAGTSASAAIHSAVLAYNLGAYGFSGGTLTAAYNPANIRHMQLVSAGRRGLLNLNGQYASSANLISTLMSKGTDFAPSAGSQGVFRVGTFSNLPVVRAIDVASVAFDSPLPAGLTFSNGFICGTLAAVPNGADYQQVDYIATATLADGSTRQLLVMLGYIAENFDTASVPPGTDPVLDIILALPTCCGPGQGSSCLAGIDCLGSCDKVDPKHMGTCFCGDGAGNDMCNQGV